jgi:hypothetical protein
MAAPPPPAPAAARAAMFARISASRPPAHALEAAAGGARDHTILSACEGALLPFFTTRAVLPLRAACRDARAAVARRGWADLDTAIVGSLCAWGACFPGARAGNAGGRARAGAAPVTAQEWACLRGLREGATGAPSLRALLVLGAGEGLAAAARGALPSVHVAAALSGECVARLNEGEGASGLAALDTGLLVSVRLDHHGNHDILRLWNAATGESVGGRILEEMGGSIAALPEGHFATVGRHDSSASVWDSASRARVCELKGHTSNVTCVVSLPGGLVATGSHDSTVRLWTAATGSHVATLRHGVPVYALAVLPDGILVSGGGCRLLQWDISTGTNPPRRWARTKNTLLRVSALAVLEGGHLASGCEKGAVRMFYTDSGACRWYADLEGHQGPVRSLAALPRGLLASGSADTTVRVWSVAARACVAVLRGHAGYVGGLTALPGGRLASGSSVICVWKLHVE